MKEKIIQIAVSSGPDATYPDLVYALTETGDVYYTPHTAQDSAKWEKLPNIYSNLPSNN